MSQCTKTGFVATGLVVVVAVVAFLLGCVFTYINHFKQNTSIKQESTEQVIR